nr:MAG TPA: hypothetical protein [Caudoviricetes sp.]DAV61929.1 MAG TPA: hypothetical protein [Caudoviricetes sp.]
MVNDGTYVIDPQTIAHGFYKSLTCMLCSLTFS